MGLKDLHDNMLLRFMGPMSTLVCSMTKYDVRGPTNTISLLRLTVSKYYVGTHVTSDVKRSDRNELRRECMFLQKALELCPALSITGATVAETPDRNRPADGPRTWRVESAILVG
jgi:hypothetical protein